MIIEAFRNYDQQSTPFDVTPFGDISLVGSNTQNDRSASVIKFVKKVKFFDFIYENLNNFSIINVNRYIFYRNVFIFIDYLKNLIKKNIEEIKIKKFILDCFKDINLI